ncbi:MAG: hypothetical protein JWO31_3215 [Phycisphaerales bacterium]|nr:hypothetical protein [Phycisphaerales bacterium]
MGIDLRRRRPRHAAALVVSVALALLYVSPYMPSGVVVSHDLNGFLGGIVEGRNALAEGQFPIRVAPNINGQSRNATFQFYANLPYTVTAALHRALEPNPYAAWKLVCFLTLVLGGWATYRLAWRWTRDPWAALASAAAFLSAPYLFADLWDRGAVAELTALCLLPLAVSATWGCFARPSVTRVVGCAAAWTALGLTHNITYLYAFTFVGLFVLSFGRPRRRYAGRAGRLAAAGLLHAALIAWFLAPQLALLGDLKIGDPPPDPYKIRFLTELRVVFWPGVRNPDPCGIPRLGLQLGWLLLAGVLAAAAAVVAPGVGRFRRGMMARLLGLWALAFAVVWQPFDFWPYLPGPYKFVQFTYRMLGFTSLFGALLGGLAVAAWSVRRHRPVGPSAPPSPRRRPPGWVGSGISVGVALTCWLYYPELEYQPRGSWRALVDRPPMTGWDAYEVLPRAPGPLPPGVTAAMPVEAARAAREANRGDRFRLRVDRPTRVTLPVAYYRGMLRVTVDGMPAAYGQDQQFTTITLPPGRHRVRVGFVGLRWANAVSLAGLATAAALLGVAKYRRLRPGAKRTGEEKRTPLSGRVSLTG